MVACNLSYPLKLGWKFSLLLDSIVLFFRRLRENWVHSFESLMFCKKNVSKKKKKNIDIINADFLYFLWSIVKKRPVTVVVLFKPWVPLQGCPHVHFKVSTICRKWNVQRKPCHPIRTSCPWCCLTTSIIPFLPLLTSRKRNVLLRKSSCPVRLLKMILGEAR